MRFIIYLLLLCVLNFECVSQSSLTKVYTSQVGLREATGRNDGVSVEKYLKTVGLGKGYPWCAAFVKWCLQEAGYVQAKVINGMALSCHRPGHLVYSKGVKIRAPIPGDVGTLYYPSLKRIGHTFFFDEEINEKVYKSVEGNTNGAGSREGNGVYVKYRSYKATHSISRWTE